MGIHLAAGADNTTCVKDSGDTTVPTFTKAPAVDSDETATTANGETDRQ